VSPVPYTSRINPEGSQAISLFFGNGLQLPRHHRLKICQIRQRKGHTQFQRVEDLAFPSPGRLVVHEHWGSSGFANTDLDQQLKQFGIQRVIVIGMIAHTCIEATGRFAMELGYHVTLVKDATADLSAEAMHAAHAINGPTYAHAITTTDALIAELGAGA
jgi:nicotinamidase-related amidase